MNPNLPLMMTVIYALAFPAKAETKCQQHFSSSNTCPEIGIDYEEVNNLCCNTSLTKLHCISTDTGRHDGNFNAIHECLAVKDVPAGYAISLEPSESPKQIHLEPCDENYYEPESRMSNAVRHDYCTFRKSSCSNETGQIRICTGGTTQDDLCGCAKGFKPSPQRCSRGFDQHDETCHCVKENCPPGTARNMTGIFKDQCPENRHVPIDYTCLSSSTPPNSTVSSSVGPLHSPKLHLMMAMVCAYVASSLLQAFLGHKF